MHPALKLARSMEQLPGFADLARRLDNLRKLSLQRFQSQKLRHNFFGLFLFSTHR